MLPRVAGTHADMQGFKCDADVVSRVEKFQQQMKRYRDALRIYRRALGLENANTSSLRKKINQAEIILKGPAH